MAFSWELNVSSETTAAAAGEVGKLRHDPFAMLPFCGYNMGDYFAHWLSFGDLQGAKLPKIFYVNWFLKGADKQYLWPGFSENCRVLKWIFNRVDGSVGAADSPIGLLPKKDTFDMSGLALAPNSFEQLFRVDPHSWLKELEELQNYLTLFGNRLPSALSTELNKMKQHLSHQ